MTNHNYSYIKGNSICY